MREPTSVGRTESRSRIAEFLARPVSGGSLAAFRIALGLLMSLEAFTLTQPIGSVAGGLTQLQNYYTGPDTQFHFPYPGFGWLPLFGPGVLNLLVVVLGVAGLAMAAGLFYRVSAALVFLTWGYFYAVESTRTYWMSYYYLELLLTFLMIWIPAGRCYSVDALRGKTGKEACIVPHWALVLLRGQLVITYFYAGIAKLNADWMLDGMPVRYFLTQPHVVAKVEHFLPSLKPLLYGTALALAISWAGAFFDILIGLLLLVRRTRILGIVLMLIFHGTNHFVLFTDIVWFPLVGVLTALIFLEPDWPQRLGRWLRKPVLAKPEWRWFVPGAIALPVVGASLGWSLRPSPGKPSPSFALGRWVMPFVLGWLGWQAIFPARHYFIPGDARITFEGLAFSWRLKAEVYRVNPAEIFVEDTQVVSSSGAKNAEIHWDAWKREPVLYRGVDPEKLNWRELPELLVLFEPAVGERILYNPYAGQTTPRDETAARARVLEIWRSAYGRAPGGVRKLVPIAEIADGYAAAMRARGGTPPANRSDLIAMLVEEHGRTGDRQMLPFLRRVQPFGFDKETPVAAPFLLIEDDLLLNAKENAVQVNRAAWKTPPGSADHKLTHTGASPLIVYTLLTPEVKAGLPPVYLSDSEANTEPPRISWNYRNELSISKQMHISTQPFLLRDYCRTIAARWEKEFGRRPAIHANTALSLNLRPHQQFVVPGVDLASVGRKFFWHNAWIRDLDLPRIPRESLAQAFNHRPAGGATFWQE